MRLSAIALDYDGTIAKDGVLSPAVREAVSQARASGIAILLVTGRILRALRALAGDFRFADAVVAENGAVLWFPESGSARVLAEAPPPEFVSEVARRGLSFAVGECVVEADAGLAPALLDVIRQLELPLSLFFNRGRVMVLPHAIGKGAGLAEALLALRLSPHNTLAIGDAENDHEMLRVAEFGAAVAWGSAVLRRAADGIVPGQSPDDVARYVREAVARGSLPEPRKGRHRLVLGHAEGRPVTLPVRAHNLLVGGDPRSGKSWVAGLIAEQLVAQHYCLVVLDPEGDYRALETLPGLMVLGGDLPPRPRQLTHALRYPDTSVVVDLSATPQPEKADTMRALLETLLVLRTRTGLPHQIVVDEAHYFLHDADACELLDLHHGGYTLVSYRLASLHPSILASCDTAIVTRESDPRELDQLGDLAMGYNAHNAHNDHRGPEDDTWKQSLANLRRGEAALVPLSVGLRREPGDQHVRFRLAPRRTPHVRHRAKDLDSPVPEGKSFVLEAGASVRRFRTLNGLVSGLETTSAADLHDYLLRHDFSRWIAEVFGDDFMAGKILDVEDEYAMGERPDPNGTLAKLIRDRYELAEEGSATGPASGVASGIASGPAIRE